MKNLNHLLDTQPKLAEWYSQETNAQWLSGFLRQPQGVLLIEVLKEMATPGEATVQLVGSMVPNLQERLASLQLLHAGQTVTLKNMIALQQPVEDVKDLPEPYSYLRDAEGNNEDQAE